MGILMGGAIRNANTHVGLPFASACVTGSFHCYSTDGSGLWNNLSDGGAYAYGGVNVTFSAGGYYEKSLNLNNIGYYPDLGINGLWEIVELMPKPTDTSSCFTGDALVHMADGTVRRIDSILAGELVLGQNGDACKVLAVERPRLGTRRLHAINGGRPFVTGEHPFLTSAGWKSIDPEATASENPKLSVGRMQVGDALVCATSVIAPEETGNVVCRAAIATGQLIVRRLSMHKSDPETRVYNLLLDADHTYIANNFIVHNKTSTH